MVQALRSTTSLRKAGYRDATLPLGRPKPPLFRLSISSRRLRTIPRCARSQTQRGAWAGPVGAFLANYCWSVAPLLHRDPLRQVFVDRCGCRSKVRVRYADLRYDAVPTSVGFPGAQSMVRFRLL